MSAASRGQKKRKSENTALYQVTTQYTIFDGSIKVLHSELSPGKRDRGIQKQKGEATTRACFGSLIQQEWALTFLYALLDVYESSHWSFRFMSQTSALIKEDILRFSWSSSGTSVSKLSKVPLIRNASYVLVKRNECSKAFLRLIVFPGLRQCSSRS